jgi:hypothetical protein
MAMSDGSATVVLLRETPGASARRLARRAVLPLLAAAGWWLGFPAWSALLLSAAALPSALLLCFGIVNLMLNHGALLVHNSSGAIVRPPSVQERLLKHSLEVVEGATVELVTEPPAVAGTRGDPRITLSAGDQRIHRIPLYGTPVETFLARANGLLEGRGTVIVRREPDREPEL